MYTIPSYDEESGTGNISISGDGVYTNLEFLNISSELLMKIRLAIEETIRLCEEDFKQKLYRSMIK